MKTFEQRIAEINRRSEEIIQKRKRNRRCILACCVPLVLCIGLWTIIPKCNTPFDATQSADGTKFENSPESMGTTAFVEVSDSKTTSVCHDAQTLSRILAILNRSGIKPETTSDQSNYTQYGTGQISVGTNGDGIRAYRITVNAADGTRTVYTLKGSLLTNEETGEVSYIMGEDLRELKQLLGLSEEGED